MSQSPGGVQEALDRAVDYGVDLSLLVERLKLSPTERVLSHQAALVGVLELRRAGEEHRRARRAGADRGTE